MKRILLLFSAVLAATPLAGRPAAGKQDTWIREILRLEAKYGGHLGFAAKNLKTGETIGYNAAERFPTASVIKLPVLAAFFQLADDKKIDPNELLTLTRADMKPGSGILQHLAEGDRITLLDAVKLMIMQSDNTATNLVLDRLAPTHAERLALVNEFVARKGLKDTRILNRLFSYDTKQRTPEAIRYGIGVSTPEDMVALLEALYTKTLVSPASCDAMTDILKTQSYREMIPRYLPEEECRYLEIGNKTGSVNETKVDVALILSDKIDLALAVFVDKQPDHRGDIENRGVLLGAMVARAVWNHFTGSSGYEERSVPLNNVDWNSYPDGRWGIYRSAAAPFPHRQRRRGFKASDGTLYPYHPHYDDNSIVVVLPSTFQETAGGTNVIVHFHGEMGDNMAALEADQMPQALADQKINAILILPQGPYRARDSFGGKMTDEGGLKRLMEDLLATMKREKIIKTDRLNRLILSAQGFGYQAAASAVKRGGEESHITDLFLWDALNGSPEAFRTWLVRGDGVLHAAYTSDAGKEHVRFEQTVKGDAKKRLRLVAATVDRGKLILSYFQSWLKELGPEWKSAR
jgi:beta-lactamase class A